MKDKCECGHPASLHVQVVGRCGGIDPCGCDKYTEAGRSCFVCGQPFEGEPAIYHVEHPEICVCLRCRTASQAAIPLLSPEQIQAINIVEDLRGLNAALGEPSPSKEET